MGSLGIIRRLLKLMRSIGGGISHESYAATGNRLSHPWFILCRLDCGPACQTSSPVSRAPENAEFCRQCRVYPPYHDADVLTLWSANGRARYVRTYQMTRRNEQYVHMIDSIRDTTLLGRRMISTTASRSTLTVPAGTPLLIYKSLLALGE